MGDQRLQLATLHVREEATVNRGEDALVRRHLRINVGSVEAPSFLRRELRYGPVCLRTERARDFALRRRSLGPLAELPFGREHLAVRVLHAARELLHFSVL